MSKKPKQPPKAKGLEAQKAAQRARDDGWYEVVEQAHDITRVRKLEGFEQDRIFLKGKIGDVHLIEVPPDMDEMRRNAIGMSLSAQGLTVLIIDESVKYLRLRRASALEEMKLNASLSKGNTNPTVSPGAGEPAADPSAGPVADGDGSHGAGEDGDAAAQHNPLPAGGDAEGGTDRLDPR